MIMTNNPKEIRERLGAGSDPVAGSRLLERRILERRIEVLEDACRVKNAALIRAAAIMEEALELIDADNCAAACATLRLAVAA